MSEARGGGSSQNLRFPKLFNMVGSDTHFSLMSLQF